MDASYVDGTVSDPYPDLTPPQITALQTKLDYDAWPPTDAVGNIYPLTWVTDKSLNDDGQFQDHNGRDVSPLTGSLEPVTNRCNAPLRDWERRYPQKRYCSQTAFSSEYCMTHSARDAQSVEGITATLLSKTVDEQYADVDPHLKVLGHGLFASLLDESTYDYDTEHETKTFDFSESAYTPPSADEDGTVAVSVVYPRAKPDRAVALWNAAMDSVMALSIKAETMDGEAPVAATTSTSHAQLTSPTEDNPRQNFKTLEELSEHPLNLPYSRLVRDRTDLLEYGGVEVGSEQSAGGLSVDDLVMNVSANPDDEDMNAAKGQSESEYIVASADETGEMDDTTSFEDPTDGVGIPDSNGVVGDDSDDGVGL